MYQYAAIKRFEKSQINGLTKHLASLRWGGSNNFDRLDRTEMWERIFNRGKELGLEIGYSEAYGERLDFTVPRKITREQTTFGKAWLKNYFFKTNGEPRKGKRTEYVSERVLGIAKSVSRFEFVGVQISASQGFYPQGATPIYRAFNRKGEYFDYSPVHWGEPLIMESM